MKILQIRTSEERNRTDVKRQELVTEEIMQPLLQAICQDSADVIVIGEWGMCVAVHLTAKLGIPCLSGIDGIQIAGDALVVSCDAYQANVKVKHKVTVPAVLVLKQEAEDVLMHTGNYEAETVPVHTGNRKAGIVPVHITNCEIKEYRIRTESYMDAGIFTKAKEEIHGDFKQDTILVIGHGVGGKENAQEICTFAQKYGFGVGATRPVVTDGWVASGHLIGISGCVIAPKVCMVLGASGSQAFMAGIGKSEIIFSVNTDKDAMIFEKSDYGLVMDCMQFVRTLDARWRESQK